jgi:hypothetical protein
MVMHKAATLIIAYLVVVTALLAGAYVPVAAHDVEALLAPSSSSTELTTQAPCTTDADCEAWALGQGMDTTPTLEPAADGGEGYVCPAGMDLHDTEMPELGAQGVVCRTHLMEV